MKAIELLEVELKKCKRWAMNNATKDEYVKVTISEIEWGLKVLKMAIGHAGETITLPKG